MALDCPPAPSQSRGLWLQPDESGKFLWAVFEVGDEILRAAFFDDPALRYASGDEFAPVIEKSLSFRGYRLQAIPGT